MVRALGRRRPCQPHHARRHRPRAVEKAVRVSDHAVAHDRSVGADVRRRARLRRRRHAPRRGVVRRAPARQGQGAQAQRADLPVPRHAAGRAAIRRRRRRLRLRARRAVGGQRQRQRLRHARPHQLRSPRRHRRLRADAQGRAAAGAGVRRAAVPRRAGRSPAAVLEHATTRAPAASPRAAAPTTTASPTPRSATSTPNDTMLPQGTALCDRYLACRADRVRRRHRLRARHVHADGGGQVHAADRSDDGAGRADPALPERRLVERAAAGGHDGRRAAVPGGDARRRRPAAATWSASRSRARPAPQVLASACPNTLVVQKIDAPYPEAVPGKGARHRLGRAPRARRPSRWCASVSTASSRWYARRCDHDDLRGRARRRAHPLRLRRQDGAAATCSRASPPGARWASSCSRATSARPTRSPR